ncbi:1,3-beta-glucanosyltransferase PGA5 [Candida viswanathii]|uniref:1,3-beta-glucanosyltransferase n=1 Tax=Candida viswanathii TaxID=5486 RepID=A0A367XPN1_9ASCO|nr:1,3-beta-glucanosyltransferase PGA5 [Candida viswanathii]
MNLSFIFTLAFISFIRAESNISTIMGVPATGEEGQSILPIRVVGNKFFECENGQQFFIKGIAYQKSRQEGEIYDATKEPHYVDPMANPFTCLRDLEYLKELGVNVIRVYQINPNANHDVCMNAFAEAGIYVLADLSEPYMSIRRDYPHWDTELFTRYKEVIDCMHKYNNMLGFFAGNEVSNAQSNIDASPFVRAALRDCKKYIAEQGYRKIPIGYASNDDASIRKNLANYFVCKLDDEYSQADFFAINVYEWCGYSTYTTSGYRDLTVSFNNYPVPVFFSEFGCNIITPRPFTEIEAIYGTTMRKVWSGGIVYEYFEEVNHYGVLLAKKDGLITKLPDFDTLKMRYNAVTPVGITIDEATNCEAKSCTQENDDAWDIALTLPPTPDQGKCECLWQSLSCVISNDAQFDEEVALKDLCFKVDCEDINANGRLGKYGKYSDCNPTVRASYALNKYYEQCGRKQEVCDFQGRGELSTGRGLDDLGSKYSSDGRNCLAILDGREHTDCDDKKEDEKEAHERHKGKHEEEDEEDYDDNDNDEEEEEKSGPRRKERKKPAQARPVKLVSGGSTMKNTIFQTIVEFLFTCGALLI